MTKPKDCRVMHPGAARLRLRSDLRFLPQPGRQPHYLVEDIVRSKYYRLGVAEYEFVSLLDGKLSLDEALSRLATLSPMSCLSEADGIAIGRWLVDQELAEIDGGSVTRTKTTVGDLLPRLNPLAFRIPLCRPDPLFDVLAPLARWIFATPAVLLWLILLIYAGYSVNFHWDRLAATSSQVFASSNWLWLVASWILLKIIHELAHGVVCKKYGAVVRQAGIIFVLFAPLAFVDVTSSWRFNNKWHRIFTATAGMYVETLLAAIAAIVWSHTAPGLVHQMAFNVVVMAGISTILINANPLMRFDGYYILSDWLGIPNLYASGQQFVTSLGCRYVLGLRSAVSISGTGPEKMVIRLFGIAAVIWRVVVCAGLIVAASALLHGLGIILALSAAGLWIGWPLARLAHLLRFGLPGQRPDRLRFFLTTSSAVVICGLVLGVVPWPGVASAPARVAYDPLSVIRTRSAGFVRAVNVVDGEAVEEGEVLVVLENRELRLEVADLQLQIEESHVKARRHEQQGELAEKQAELTRRESLMERMIEQQRQLEDLAVRAPASGHVIGPRLNSLLGTYLAAGEELLVVAEESSKEVELSIAQEDIDRFQSHLAQQVSFWVPGIEMQVCRLSRIEPRAAVDPPNWAFAATNSGPIAVQPVDNPDGEQRYEFLAPRFVGRVDLSAEQSRALRAGQMGFVSLTTRDERVGQHLYRRLSNWVRAKLVPTLRG